MKTNIDKFKKLFDKGISQIEQACKIYAKDVDVLGKKGKKAYIEALPHIPRGIFDRFYAVGKGLLTPVLLFGLSEGEQELSKCPLRIQEDAIKNGVKVLLDGGDNMIIAIKDLDYSDTMQVFNEGNVRSLSEQKQYIRRQKEIEERIDANIAEAKAKKIAGGKVCRLRKDGRIYINGSFTRPELLKITRELLKGEEA